MTHFTRAMKGLLKDAADNGAVSMGGYGRGQHHRPARKLEDLGFLEFGWWPLRNSDSVCQLLGRNYPGLKCQGWAITEAGRSAIPPEVK